MDDRDRIAELTIALRDLVAYMTKTETCGMCNANMGRYPCWQRYQGEICLLREGHAGEHNNVMSAFRWKQSDPTDLSHKCGAGGFDTPHQCGLPRNHDGPHALPRKVHKEFCLIPQAKGILEKYGDPDCLDEGT